jgi:hypothetical protein
LIVPLALRLEQPLIALVDQIECSFNRRLAPTSPPNEKVAMPEAARAAVVDPADTRYCSAPSTKPGDRLVENARRGARYMGATAIPKKAAAI